MSSSEDSLAEELVLAVEQLLGRFGIYQGDVVLRLVRPTSLRRDDGGQEGGTGAGTGTASVERERAASRLSSLATEASLTAVDENGSTAGTPKTARSTSSKRSNSFSHDLSRSGNEAPRLAVTVDWADSFTPLGGGLTAPLPPPERRSPYPPQEDGTAVLRSPMTLSLQSSSTPMTGRLRPQQTRECAVGGTDGAAESTSRPSSRRLPSPGHSSRHSCHSSPEATELKPSKRILSSSGTRTPSVRFPAERAPPRTSRRHGSPSSGVYSRRPVFSILNTNKEDNGLSRSNASVRVDEGEVLHSPLHEPLVGTRAEMEASRQRSILRPGTYTREEYPSSAAAPPRTQPSIAFSDSGSYRPLSSSGGPEEGRSTRLGLATFRGGSAIAVEGKAFTLSSPVSPSSYPHRSPRPYRASVVSEKEESANTVNH